MKSECVCMKCGRVIPQNRNGAHDAFFLRIQRPVVVKRMTGILKNRQILGTSMKQEALYKLCTECYDQFSVLIEGFMFRDV